jgi:predicted TIM-barrel fold metal-dependent hydrolase
MSAPVVDFHLHFYDRPLRAPESFVAFMDRELAGTHGSFARDFPDLAVIITHSGRPIGYETADGARERILGGNAARIPRLA